MAKKIIKKVPALVDQEKFQVLPFDKLVKAAWNYKEDNDELKEKLKANLKLNGQVENLLVRELDTGFYEVVNGNHRYDALAELECTEVMCYNLGAITETQAKRIAIETNETRFKSDNIKLAGLIKEIGVEINYKDLALTMPYTEEELRNFDELLNFDWKDEPPGDSKPKAPQEVTCPHCGETFTLGEASS